MKKRLFAFLLALCLVMNMTSGIVFAEATEGDGVVVPEEHEHYVPDNAEWEEIKAPSCTEAGSEKTVCGVENCNEIITRPIAKLNHVPCKVCDTDDTDSTCTEKGHNFVHCEICGDLLKQENGAPVVENGYYVVCEGAAHDSKNCECYKPYAGNGTGKHSYVYQEGLKNDCGNDGHSDYMACEYCGEIDPEHKKETLPATGDHKIVADYSFWPFCAEVVTKEGANIALPSHCEVCGQQIVDEEHKVVAFVEHNLVPVEAQAPDCEYWEYGWIDYLYCDDCGKCFLADKDEAVEFFEEIVIWPEHDFSEEYGATAGSCEEGAWKSGLKCSVCGALDGDNMPEQSKPEGHKLAQYTGYAATCTEDGMMDYVYCTKCGEAVEGKLADWTVADFTALENPYHKGDTFVWDYDEDGEEIRKSVFFIPATGHDWVSKDGVPATCTEPGMSAYEYCSVCGVENPEAPAKVIPAHKHSYEENGYWPESYGFGWYEPRFDTFEVPVDPYIAPNCYEEGQTYGYKCVWCDEEVKSEVIPALNHVLRDEEGNVISAPVKVLEAINPTCDTEGWSDVWYCELCGHDFGGGEVINKLGHQPVYVEYKLPGCEEDEYGWYGYWYCARTFEPGLYMDEDGNVYETEDWTHCDCAVAYEQSFDHVLKDGSKVKYTIAEDEEIVATYYVDEDGEVVTPWEFVIYPYFHYYFEEVNDRAPTCTVPGVAEGSWRCLVCDAEEIELIPATNHPDLNMENCYDPGNAPTCTEPGNRNYWHCLECNYVAEYDESMLDENGDFDMDKVREALTKSKTQWTEEWYTIPATGHTKTEGKYQAPTCTEPGKNAGYYCSVCLTSLEGCELIPATGHHFTKVLTDEEGNDLYPYDAPNCIEEGRYAMRACADCEAFDENPQFVCLGEDCNHVLFDEYDCLKSEEECNEEEMCDDCKANKPCAVCVEIPEDGVIPALGHIRGEWIPNRPATCTEFGYSGAYHCTRECCSDPYNYYEILDAYYAGIADGSMTPTGIDVFNAGWLKIPVQLPKTSHEFVAYEEDVYCPNQIRNDKYDDLLVCENCGGFSTDGETLIAEEDLLAHLWIEVSDEDKVAATCEKGGVDGIRQCYYCKLTEKNIIPALGHDWVYVAFEDATCAGDGVEEHYDCSRCDKVAVKDEDGEYVIVDAEAVVIPEHTEHCDEDLHVDEKKPTCREKGNSEGWKCDVCGDYEYEVYEPDPVAYHKYLSDNKEALLADGILKWTLPKVDENAKPGSALAYIECGECGYIVDVKLYPEVKMGDVNMDNDVDVIDALMILQFEAGALKELPNEVVADCYADGVIDVVDALWVLNYDATKK